MKLGVNIGYWGLGLTSQDQLEIVREDERLGYDSVWTAEAYGSDAATIIGWLAGQTSKIRLGSAIFQMPARSPAMTAMTAATLDQLSGGRLEVGLGLGYREREFELLGVPRSERAFRTEELVRTARRVWGDGTVTPPPFQQPEPPFWIGGSTAAAARRRRRAPSRLR